MRTSILQVKAIFGLYGGNIRLSLDADGKNGTLFIKNFAIKHRSLPE